MTEASPDCGPGFGDDVRRQLERILSSQALAGSDQLQRLLRLVVERTLDGKPELLKEYNLGQEVFHRPADYDPKVDPIVRVQARRLRAKLDEYYAGSGAHDPLVIQLPKGAYVPAFVAQTPNPVYVPPAPASSSARRLWPSAAAAALLALILAVLWMRQETPALSADIDRSVAVLPLKMFTESGNRAYIADQVAEVLTTELAKSKQLRVLSRTTASKYRDSQMSLPDTAQALRVRWVIEGGVGVEGTRAYIKLRSVDARTDRKVWADVFDCDISELVAVNRRAAVSMAAAIVAGLHPDARP